MFSIVKTATSLACLAAVVLAGPINKNSLSRREWTDCPTGTVFYACANGYRGCYQQDPCALPPIASTSLPATPTPTTSVTAAPPTATCQSGSIWQPTMYNLDLLQPDLSQTPVTYLQVQASGASKQLEQVVVFSGIPAGAKTCNLMWAQAAEAERTFVVDGSGLAAILPLTGVPSLVSANSIKPYLPAADTKPVHPDFTFWDKQSKDAATHTVGRFNCAEEVYYKIQLDTQNGDGRVYLEQDGKNGLYVTYEC
ncbi:uncharacterized protein GGS22DRAFT_153618 [Annulohypoxylon maeteangense]|uniref:uncharacterized protein n=1 Tax=Annulohypoxylon maeteangense TaxID=1927788 RepID=UPI002007BD26|nr:uncharacterized protein GGS22DRAFT_153618 [Annulohypoxylon maeteangense]KAI0889307.1 hypothetical protein GGS22DRAFT_153618 [Annulohypoxylon maeteangense]